MQVVTLADVIHGDGVTLRQHMKSFSTDEVGSSRYDWAREDLSSRDWTLWCEGLKITSQNETLPFFDSLRLWLTVPTRYGNGSIPHQPGGYIGSKMVLFMDSHPQHHQPSWALSLEYR